MRVCFVLCASFRGATRPEEPTSFPLCFLKAYLSGRCSGKMTSPSMVTTRYSRRLASSRTFPGHLYAQSPSTVSLLNLIPTTILLVVDIKIVNQQKGYIFRPLTQGRDVERHHVEPVEGSLRKAPEFIFPSRSWLVAAMIRTSTFLGLHPPNRVTS